MLCWNSIRLFQILTLILSLITGGLSYAQPGPAKSGNAQSLNTLTGQKINEENLAEKNKKFNGTWRLRLQGTRGEDPFNQRSTVDFAVLANLNYQPTDLLGFNLSPSFKYLNGFAQTQNRTDTNESKVLVRNASADLKVGGVFEASVGALDQEKMHHPILLDEVAFPAARIGAYTSDQNDYQVGALAESAIATSSSLSTQTKEAEKTPTFNSAGIFGKAESTYVDANLSVMMWQFENLPMSLATQSSFAGNTGTPVGGTTDKIFTYQYKGIEAFGKLKFKFNNRIALGLNAAFVRNDQAPSELNQGTWARGFVEYYVNRTWMVTPAYEFFRIEPDAAVAAYNSDLHYTNTVGYRAGLGVEYRKTVRVSIHGGEKDVLYITPTQQRERFWNLKLETLDVAL